MTWNINDPKSAAAVDRAFAGAEARAAEHSPEAAADRALAAAVQLIAEEHAHVTKKLDGIREASQGPRRSPGS